MRSSRSPHRAKCGDSDRRTDGWQQRRRRKYDCHARTDTVRRLSSRCALGVCEWKGWCCVRGRRGSANGLCRWRGGEAAVSWRARGVSRVRGQVRGRGAIENLFDRGLRDWKLAAKHVGSAQVQYNGTLIVVGTDRRGLISSGTGSIIVLGCIMRCLRYVVSTTICG
jgi:hypothetical protein